MKKILVLSVFSLTLLAHTASHAYVDRSGFYLGMSAGGSYVRSTIKQKNNSKMENDTVFLSSLAMGIRFRYIRAALEATMNTKAEYKDYTYENNAASAQLYFDVPFRSRLRPYFNVGGGFAESKITAEPNVESKKNKPFWNVGGGFSLAVSPSTNVDLGYRYSRFPKVSFPDANNQTVSVENENHSGYLGVRYVF